MASVLAPVGARALDGEGVGGVTSVGDERAAVRERDLGGRDGGAMGHDADTEASRPTSQASTRGAGAGRRERKNELTPISRRLQGGLPCPCGWGEPNCVSSRARHLPVQPGLQTKTN